MTGLVCSVNGWWQSIKSYWKDREWLLQDPEELKKCSVGQLENWLHGAKILGKIQKKLRKLRMEANRANPMFDPVHIDAMITPEFDPGEEIITSVAFSRATGSN